MNTERISVIDDVGYVRFVEAYGTGDAGKDGVQDTGDGAQYYGADYECGIVEAARQSTQGSFRGWGEDGKLLAFLLSNNHATPFEFAGLILEVQAPIFVFREWQRHRTQSYNEMSARYAPLPSADYTPTVDRLLLASAGGGKQAAAVVDAETLDAEGAEQFRHEAAWLSELVERHYQKWLRMGVPKELARVRLPVGRYSRMRCAANLRNWLAFMTLRADPKAQWEIQQYARAVGDVIAAVFPNTWSLYEKARAKR